jgi:hypothetical protein
MIRESGMEDLEEGGWRRGKPLSTLGSSRLEHTKNTTQRGRKRANFSAAAGGLNPYILAASLAAHPERFDHGFPFIDRVAIFASCTTRHAMARETATALREANEDGPAKTVALQEQVPIESPL